MKGVRPEFSLQGFTKRRTGVWNPTRHSPTEKAWTAAGRWRAVRDRARHAGRVPLALLRRGL